MDLLYVLDIFGTLVFAISGVLTAIDREFDIVGSIVIGFATAVGGGTLRDMMIGETPVAWMLDSNYIYAIIVAVLISYLFQKQILRLRKGMFLFDTIGIALFTILGLEKTLLLGLSPLVAVMMGIVSAVFGGVIRDVLTNDVPLIFRKEIYASACLLGSLVYLTMHTFCPIKGLNICVAMISVLLIRYFAVKYHWSLQWIRHQ
jgi:uncharacterized membrane protein YeiH